MNKPNDLFFTLAENAPVAIVVIDAAKTISYANQHAEQLIGENHENVLNGRKLLEYIAPEDTQLVLENIDRIKQRAGSLPFIITIITNKGIQKIVEVTLAATEAASDEQYIIYLRDISLHQKAEEEKFALERQLRAIYKMEALGQLASGIAHDLNNNLGAIAGYSELIKHIVPHTDEKVCKYASQISSAAARSAQVIQKVLTFARKNRMQVSSFNANDVVGDTINLIKPTFDKSITIEDRCEADHAIVTGDPEQIQNALLNLALNARDAMLGGGVLTISTRNVFVDEALAASRRYKMTQGYYLIISVSDTGSGMDQDTQAHLFEPFFTTKEAGRGTGLGLASVYGSVKNHHGYIDVTSDVGKGSCFSLYLPVNRTVVPAENEESAGDSDVAPAPKAHLLVIDDEQSIAEMLMELLSWLNYSATIFTDAAQAIDFYKSHRNDIDLAIIDMNMPEIDGLECFEKLRRINPKIKAMIATGYCLDDEREHMLKSGISGVLSKPFVSADLAKAVAEALAEND